MIGLKYRGKNEPNDIPQLWQEFMQRAGEISNAVGDLVSYGVMGRHDTETGEFDYLAAVEVKGEGEVPEGLERWDIPAQTYAVFTFPFHAIKNAYEHAFGQWSEETGKSCVGGTDFERYGAQFDPRGPASEMGYWMPVTAETGA